MDKLTASELMKLEDYARERDAFRDRVMAHKRNRRLPLGPNLTLYFEDRLTMQYQVQEMLRAERIFEAAGIEEELDAYNPLIPDGDNLKATAMIEFPDEAERRRRLRDLVGIEDLIWIRAGDEDPVYAIADEDLERATEDKTSAVHFLRFQLPPESIEALKSGAPLRAGVRHGTYTHEVVADDETREALVEDLD